MPALQVVDLSPTPRTTQTPLEQTLASFTQKHKENQMQQRESDALGEIYQQFQQDGHNIENAYVALQKNPNLSPTQRVNATNNLLNLAKTNSQMQATAAKKAKAQEKSEADVAKKEKENADEEEKKANNAQIVRTIERERGLEPNSLAGFEQNPTLANAYSRPKNEPRPLQSNQPIPEDQLRRIQEVRKNPDYQNASSPMKYQMLTDAGVSSNYAKAESEIFAENEKLVKQQEEVDRRQRNIHHKEWQKYDDQIASNATGAKHQLDSIKDTEKAIASGKVKPNSIANIFRKIGGKAGDALAEAFLSGDEATLLASIPAFLEGRKELFGVRLSDADLALLRDKLPDIGKSKEANMAILKLMKRSADKAVLKEQIARDVKKQSQGLRPADYRDQVEERYDALVKEVEVVDPKTGKKLPIPTYKLAAALKAGAKLANEQQ